MSAIYKPTKHNLSHAQLLFRGKNSDEYVQYGINGDEPGIPIHPATKVSLGNVPAALATGFINGATSTNLPNAATKTYTAATSGTAPLNSGSIPTPITLYPLPSDPLVWPLAEAATTAGSFVPGNEYCVLSVGTTDFNQCAYAPLNNQTGKQFTAANAGAGTGTAAHLTPRNITATATHATSVVAMTILVSGYDKYLQPMTEQLSIAATGTSQSATGKKAFAFVSSIAITSAGNATTNTLNVGWGSALGLPFQLLDKSNLIQNYFNEVPDSAWPTVVAAVTATPSATTGDVRGTVTMASALNASPVELWMYTDLSINTTPVVPAQA